MLALILDPGLFNRSGHHFEMARGLRRGLENAGFGCRIIVQRNAGRDVQAELQVVPLFRDSHYTSIPDELGIGARRLSRDLETMGDPGVTDGDLLIFPTASPRQLAGAASWLEKLDTAPRVFGLFHRVEPPGTALEPGSGGAATYRTAANAISRAVGPSRLLLCATNNFLAGKLGGPMNMDIATIAGSGMVPGGDGRLSSGPA